MRLGALLLALSCFGACASGDPSGAPAGLLGTIPGSASASLPSRSAKCRQWQSAECDFEVGCGWTTFDDCTNLYQSAFCEDDSIVQSCLQELSTADCSTGVPEACLNVPDPTPAVRFCDDLLDAWCTKRDACGLETKAGCIASNADSLECNKAEGVTAGGAACLDQIPLLECSGLSFPTECNGVIIIRSGGSNNNTCSAGNDCSGCQDGCSSCMCQTNNDAAACASSCTCQPPSCTGCQDACSACLCGSNNYWAACGSTCGCQPPDCTGCQDSCSACLCNGQTYASCAMQGVCT